ncbi:MAG: glycoside hydrolase family 9 protein [Candidatus Goldbacteria bacterium]|nr:glycoside hydrolase family 9 protein [Candidatus Goldiibacteriota bacterium]
MRKYVTALLVIFISLPVFSAPVSHMITVDQIGYRPAADKFAMIKNPITGQDSAVTYVPGAEVQLRRASDETVVMTIPLTKWNGGAEDTVFSGDAVWHADFSSFAVPGTYHVFDPVNNYQSYNFEIGDTIYNRMLEASVKSFFYQRCGTEIKPANGGVWSHAACHMQQASAHLYDSGLGGDQGAASARDVTGGWHDAGDYRKYVTFAAPVMWTMLHMYEWWPDKFSDNTNIPESGNGVPDVLDEAKYEIDWLLKMQRADGALYSGVFVVTGINGTNDGHGDPSLEDRPFFYANFSTAATGTGCYTFALAAKLFAPYSVSGGPYEGYSAVLKAAAENAWSFLHANPGNIQYNHTNFQNANANKSDHEDQRLRALSAAELFALTGSTVYRDYFDGIYDDPATADNGWHQPIAQNYFETAASEALQMAMVSYALAPGATVSVVNAIKTSLKNGIEWNITSNIDDDPYKSHIWPGHYTWGSNQFKAVWGYIPVWGVKLGVNPVNTALYNRTAEEYVHYFFGRNAFSMSFLTGDNLGTEHHISQFYHGWFWDGSVFDTNPAPGFLSGGPNNNYEQNTTDSGGTVMNPPGGEPPAKSYRDWNTNWPDCSWSVTENGIYYQAKFNFLLAAFAGPVGPTPTPTQTPTDTPYAGTPTFTYTASDTPTTTPTFTATFTPDVNLFNTCDILTYNGIWSGANSDITLNSTNVSAITQGSGAVQINVTTTAGWQDGAAMLSGFSPGLWSNVVELRMDIYVEPGSAPWGDTDAWHSLALYADAPAASPAPKWYRRIAADSNLTEGMNNVVFVIDFSLDTEADPILSSDVLDNLRFVISSENGGTGTIYFDNMVIVTSGTGAPTHTATAYDTETFTPTDTQTQVPPTQTFTATDTETLIAATNTYTYTPTDTQTEIQPTQTFTQTETETGIASTNTYTYTPTDTQTQVLPVNTYTTTETETVIASTNTYTYTPTDTQTQIQPTQTFTHTETQTDIAPTNTYTYTPTDTQTQVFPTQTFTQTETDTVMASTNTYTYTPTDTQTQDASTQTFTQTETETVMASTNTYTYTPTDTQTQLLPTHTYTETAMASTNTYTYTPTDTQTQDASTQTFTQTETETAMASTNTYTYTPTDTQTQLLPTHTYTQTETETAMASTNTYTNTPTDTYTQIPQTQTFTPTETYMPVNTPTYTQTPEINIHIEADNGLSSFFYPNPGAPGLERYLAFKLENSSESVICNIYTSSFRLVESKKIQGPFVSGWNTVKVSGGVFGGLSNGVYYYVLTACFGEKTERITGINKFIILK